MFLSSSSTSACMPSAIAAAFMPETPAPMTTTLAAYTPGTPPISTPRPPPERIRWYDADLRGQPAGHLGHRRQQRQRPVGQLHRLVRDAGDPAVQQRVGALPGRGQVQVGEEHLTFAHPVVLLGDRLLDLEDQVAGRPDLVGVGQDRAPAAANSSSVIESRRRRRPRRRPRDRARTNSLHAGRRDRHPVLVVLDLAGDCRPSLSRHLFSRRRGASPAAPRDVPAARWARRESRRSAPVGER